MLLTCWLLHCSPAYFSFSKANSFPSESVIISSIVNHLTNNVSIKLLYLIILNSFAAGPYFSPSSMLERRGYTAFLRAELRMLSKKDSGVNFT